MKMDYKEIKSGQLLRDKLLVGVDKICDTVLTTMGPGGKTVIIADAFNKPYITKDGVSVSNYIKLSDPVENTAATLLKEVAQLTVSKAGDGTTTSMCLAQAIIKLGAIFLDENVEYKDLKVYLDELEVEVIKLLKEKSIRLKKSQIKDVATISSNNDQSIGDIIQKAYNHSNIVRVEEFDSYSDELTLVNGMEFHSGFASQFFINNARKRSIEYTDPKIIVVDGKLEKMEQIRRILESENRDTPLIILADHFSESLTGILRDNYNRGALQVGLIKNPGFGGHRRNLVTDVVKYINGKEVTKGVYISTSSVAKFYADDKKFIITNSNVELGSYLDDLKAAYKVETSKSSKELLKKRIATLQGKVSIIRVGGKSEVEMKERRDRMEDAVLAVDCALQEGIVEGGGLCLAKISEEIDNPFAVSLLAPYKTIVSKLDEDYAYKNLFEEKIIDPVKVTRCAFENAISVSKTILSTDALVLDSSVWS